MKNRMEELVKIIFKRYKSSHPQVSQGHPEDEELACFLEGRLSADEDRRMKEHLINCDKCAEVVADGARAKEAQEEVPSELLERMKDIVGARKGSPSLEIILKVKDRILELLGTTGDVVVGREFVPAPVLRSRQIKDFKDEVTILKDIRDTRVEIKIENKGASLFSLAVAIKDKESSRPIKDLRVTLLENDAELESYLTDYGKVVFEHLTLGRYAVEISTPGEKLASILLDVKT